MAPRTKKPEPIAHDAPMLSTDVWAREVITRLYLARYGQQDTERINELVTRYVRILAHEGVHEVRPVAREDEPTPVEKPKRTRKAKA